MISLILGRSVITRFQHMVMSNRYHCGQSSAVKAVSASGLLFFSPLEDEGVEEKESGGRMLLEVLGDIDLIPGDPGTAELSGGDDEADELSASAGISFSWYSCQSKSPNQWMSSRIKDTVPAKGRMPLFLLPLPVPPVLELMLFKIVGPRFGTREAVDFPEKPFPAASKSSSGRGSSWNSVLELFPTIESMSLNGIRCEKLHSLTQKSFPMPLPFFSGRERELAMLSSEGSPPSSFSSIWAEARIEFALEPEIF